MKKDELRKKYKDLRLALSPSEVNLFSEQLRHEFMEAMDDKFRSIHLFLPIKKMNEPDTMNLLKDLWQQHKITYTSVTHHATGKLSHYLIDENTNFKLDQWGIPIPVNALAVPDLDPDLILVPLVYCDPKGNRIGFGKGFYDRFLEEYQNVNLCGYNFFEPLEPIDDVEKHDIKLDQLFVPGKHFEFK